MLDSIPPEILISISLNFFRLHRAGGISLEVFQTSLSIIIDYLRDKGSNVSTFMALLTYLALGSAFPKELEGFFKPDIPRLLFRKSDRLRPVSYIFRHNYRRWGTFNRLRCHFLIYGCTGLRATSKGRLTQDPLLSSISLARGGDNPRSWRGEGAKAAGNAAAFMHMQSKFTKHAYRSSSHVPYRSDTQPSTPEKLPLLLRRRLMRDIASLRTQVTRLRRMKGSMREHLAILRRTAGSDSAAASSRGTTAELNRCLLEGVRLKASIWRQYQRLLQSYPYSAEAAIETYRYVRDDLEVPQAASLLAKAINEILNINIEPLTIPIPRNPSRPIQPLPFIEGVDRHHDACEIDISVSSLGTDIRPDHVFELLALDDSNYTIPDDCLKDRGLLLSKYRSFVYVDVQPVLHTLPLIRAQVHEQTRHKPLKKLFLTAIVLFLLLIGGVVILTLRMDSWGERAHQLVGNLRRSIHLERDYFIYRDSLEDLIVELEGTTCADSLKPLAASLSAIADIESRMFTAATNSHLAWVNEDRKSGIWESRRSPPYMGIDTVIGRSLSAHSMPVVDHLIFSQRPSVPSLHDEVSAYTDNVDSLCLLDDGLQALTDGVEELAHRLRVGSTVSIYGVNRELYAGLTSNNLRLNASQIVIGSMFLFIVFSFAFFWSGGRMSAYRWRKDMLLNALLASRPHEGRAESFSVNTKMEEVFEHFSRIQRLPKLAARIFKPQHIQDPSEPRRRQQTSAQRWLASSSVSLRCFIPTLTIVMVLALVSLYNANYPKPNAVDLLPGASTAAAIASLNAAGHRLGWDQSSTSSHMLFPDSIAESTAELIDRYNQSLSFFLSPSAISNLDFELLTPGFSLLGSVISFAEHVQNRRGCARELLSIVPQQHMLNNTDVSMFSDIIVHPFSHPQPWLLQRMTPVLVALGSPREFATTVTRTMTLLSDDSLPVSVSLIASVVNDTTELIDSDVKRQLVLSVPQWSSNNTLFQLLHHEIVQPFAGPYHMGFGDLTHMALTQFAWEVGIHPHAEDRYDAGRQFLDLPVSDIIFNTSVFYDEDNYQSDFELSLEQSHDSLSSIFSLSRSAQSFESVIRVLNASLGSEFDSIVSTGSFHLSNIFSHVFVPTCLCTLVLIASLGLFIIRSRLINTLKREFKNTSSIQEHRAREVLKSRSNRLMSYKFVLAVCLIVMVVSMKFTISAISAQQQIQEITRLESDVHQAYISTFTSIALAPLLWEELGMACDRGSDLEVYNALFRLHRLYSPGQSTLDASLKLLERAIPYLESPIDDTVQFFLAQVRNSSVDIQSILNVTGKALSVHWELTKSPGISRLAWQPFKDVSWEEEFEFKSRFAPETYPGFNFPASSALSSMTPQAILDGISKASGVSQHLGNGYVVATEHLLFPFLHYSQMSADQLSLHAMQQVRYAVWCLRVVVAILGVFILVVLNLLTRHPPLALVISHTPISARNTGTRVASVPLVIVAVTPLILALFMAGSIINGSQGVHHLGSSVPDIIALEGVVRDATATAEELVRGPARGMTPLLLKGLYDAGTQLSSVRNTIDLLPSFYPNLPYGIPSSPVDAVMDLILDDWMEERKAFIDCVESELMTSDSSLDSQQWLNHLPGPLCIDSSFIEKSKIRIEILTLVSEMALDDFDLYLEDSTLGKMDAVLLFLPFIAWFLLTLFNINGVIRRLALGSQQLMGMIPEEQLNRPRLQAFLSGLSVECSDLRYLSNQVTWKWNEK
eukprot:gnl/Dysnectes_brevis/5338_a7631_297.p1 GENE.gnl/Dysnectes_brevis/5338_a7631_297~~gnl/Dysnectes_brevis/5338_a7631_297.p1  ORF type:complete len:1803 (+),score=313.15 gnl/Dysnectes_brevis/5338_a7631_297:224-5410(+)